LRSGSLAASGRISLERFGKNADEYYENACNALALR
jgi:hypothetical protein